MAAFHTLKVSDVRKETDDCVSIALEIPADLKKDFSFIQGQYLTFKLNVNGEEIRRSYSICSPVSSGELRIAAKKVPHGRGSTFLNDAVRIGDELTVMTPMGNFHTKVDASQAKNYVLFAGGSGITPMLSILLTVLSVEKDSLVTLVYANRNKASVIFGQALEEISAQSEGRLTIHHVLEEGGEGMFSGLLTVDRTKEIIDAHIDLSGDTEVFICGPGPMMENIKNALTETDLPKDQLHIEYFTAVLEDLEAVENDPGQAVPSAKVKGKVTDNVTAKVTAQVTVIMDDEEFEFTLDSDGAVILDAADSAGVDAPFSCKGGVCCTCKARVLEGKVTMDKNYSLSDGEIADGYILTCQSHPASEKVVVTYDVI